MQSARYRMKHNAVLAVTVCLLLALVAPTLAQVSSSYDLSWHAIAGGSGRMESAGGHAVLGTAGQASVGTMMTGSGYVACSGFWCGAAGPYRVYLPLAMRGFYVTSGLDLSEDFDGPR